MLAIICSYIAQINDYAEKLTSSPLCNKSMLRLLVTCLQISSIHIHSHIASYRYLYNIGYSVHLVATWKLNSLSLPCRHHCNVQPVRI